MRHEGDGGERPSLCDGFIGCGLHGTLFSTLYSKSNYLDRLLPCLWNSMFSQPLWMLLYYFVPHNYGSSFLSPIDSCIVVSSAYWTSVIDLCWALFSFLSPQGGRGGGEGGAAGLSAGDEKTFFFFFLTLFFYSSPHLSLSAAAKAPWGLQAPAGAAASPGFVSWESEPHWSNFRASD